MLVRELRVALRSLRKSPLFTLVAVLTLGIGLGANTALFSLFNAVLLSPFPYHQPERLVLVSGSLPQRGIESSQISYRDHQDLESQSRKMAAIAVYARGSYNLSAGSQRPVQVKGARVSAGYFSVLGLKPLAGRLFTAEEDSPGGERVVVVGERLWREQLGQARDLLGRTLTIDSLPYSVVGIMPMKAELAERVDLWLPAGGTPFAGERTHRVYLGIARLAAGAGFDDLQTELAVLSARLEQSFPEANKDLVFKAETLREAWFGGAREVVTILLVMVGFVLFIACANVASLILARAAGREREMALRTALGSSRGGLLRSLLAESLILAMLSVILGLAFGYWGGELLVRSIPVELPAWFSFDLDARVVAYTVIIAFMAFLVFGLVPAVKASRPRFAEILKDAGAGRGSEGRERQRLWRALVTAEFALSLVLLVLSGLMVKSFIKVSAISPGFSTLNRISFGVDLPDGKYGDDTRRREVVREVLRQLGSLPGVIEVGAISQGLPLQRGSVTRELQIEGRVQEEQLDTPIAIYHAVTPSYFSVMGIPLVSGALFEESDGGRPVALVDRELARRYWPERSPVGAQLRVVHNQERAWVSVVGVVANVQQDGLDQDLRPTLYVPYWQDPSQRISFVVQAADSPLGLTRAIRQQVSAIDPELPLRDVMTLDEVRRRSLWQWRFFTTLFWASAFIALLLATLGIYGVVAYTVAQRTREIGIRIAIGAQKRQIVTMVLRQTAGILLGGLLLGLLTAWATSQVMESILFQVRAGDPLVFGIAMALLVMVSAAAAYLPGVRATRISPLEALRSE